MPDVHHRPWPLKNAKGGFPLSRPKPRLRLHPRVVVTLMLISFCVGAALGLLAGWFTYH